MGQPISLGQSVRVMGTAAGTTVVRDRSANLIRVILPANQTGTATFYDTNVADGTAATNHIVAVAQTSGSIPSSFEVGVTTRNGLTYVVGGTVDFTIVVE
jgi:hypothetical protein